MVEYHFTRADYMKDAFYAVMVGLAFAALIILYAGESERNSRNRGVIYPVCDF